MAARGPWSQLVQLLAAPDRQARLAEAALLLAQLDCPDIHVAAQLEQIQSHADIVRRRLPADVSVLDALKILNHYLFVELGFAGNSDDYYDQRNSDLAQVLSRRIGIPITLSILYIDIARRLGLRVSGMALPGHFLVRCDGAGATYVVDPFDAGAFLDNQALQELLLRSGSDFTRAPMPLAHWMKPVDVVAILLRMLRNVKAIYVKEQNWLAALAVCDRMLLISPEQPNELRDRALYNEHLRRIDEAKQDYWQILQLTAPPELQSQARERLAALGGWSSTKH